MTWPFENNTNGIVKNLVKRNLKSEKRRNIMVVIAVALVCVFGLLIRFNRYFYYKNEKGSGS